MWVLLQASALFVTPAQAAGDAELAAAEEVLNASDGDEAEADEREPASENLLEITWSTLLTASGAEPETNLQLDQTGGWRVEDLLRPRRNKLYPSTSVALYTEVVAADWLLLRGLVDTREMRDGDTLEPPVPGLTMNGNEVEDELRSGAWLRELSAVMGHDAVTVEVGRFRADVADGLVYKDFGAGVRVRADLQDLDVAPLHTEILLTTVGQRVQEIGNNQVFAARIDWMLSTFEYIAFFVALTEDKNGELSEVLRSAYAQTLLSNQSKLDSLFLQDEGSGGVGHIGLMAQIITSDDAVLRARLALSAGKLRLDVPLDEAMTTEDLLAGQRIEIEVSGAALDAELRYGLTDEIEVAGFVFGLSGDQPPRTDGDRYRAFIGLAPYWVWTGLFFSGGLAQGLYPNRAAAAGVNGHGVFGLGPSLLVDGGELSTEVRAMILSSAVDAPAAPLGGGGRTYGVELNWLGQWQIVPWFGLGAELDVLFPGDFFPTRRVAYLALAMLTLSNAR